MNYRLDPATTYTAVPMTDNGTGGDTVAGDGIYSATIPGQTANMLVAFYFSATDSRAPRLVSRPCAGDNSRCASALVMFGDGNPSGSFSGVPPLAHPDQHRPLGQLSRI